LAGKRSIKQDSASADYRYEVDTHANPHWIVRWPHQRRIELAMDEIARGKPATLLDYGTGDAYLMERLAQRGELPQTVAYEPVEQLAGQARATIERCGLQDRVTIVPSIDDFRGQTFDAIACLSVLEHMPLPQRELFYGLCDELLSPTGRVVLEVPVELGPSLLVKELGRTQLKGRDAEYPFGELLKRAVGRGGRDPVRYDTGNLETWIGPHTNFDHRCLVDEIAEHFKVLRKFGSPLPHMPALIGNQEYFVIFGRR
jgi:hypothetical protein